MVNLGLPPGAPSPPAAAGREGPTATSLQQHQMQLTFVATMKAMTSGCPCETCDLLRRAVAEMVEAVTPKVAQDAPCDDPPA